ncbi:unannotated protein [freshwater metagenome]|uniref:Unannotated protein n=1 Tax=freshwater metagenome TaxID=449393 RepID=A0A6J7PG39_9ZZZZ
MLAIQFLAADLDRQEELQHQLQAQTIPSDRR